jgi:hypothetical protein
MMQHDRESRGGRLETEDQPDGPSGHQELSSGLPAPLLQAYPRYYPGTWAPPAVMLTWASVIVLLASLAFVWRDNLTRNLFRFPVPRAWQSPWDHYYLLIPILTAGLAFWIVKSCAVRPGPGFPRFWALILFAASSVMAVWGLVDCFVLRNYRGSPMFHGATAAVLMSVLALTPRLKRVLPYEAAVLHVAVISLVIVLCSSILSATLIGNSIIHFEKGRVLSSANELRHLADEIRAAATYNWASVAVDPEAAKQRIDRLKTFNLAAILPDSYVWDAARIMKLDGDLQDATAGLSDAVTFALTQGPRLNVPPYVADSSGEKWELQHRFAPTAEITAGYFREVKRMADDLDRNPGSAPDAAGYAKARDQYRQEVDRMSHQFDLRWLALLVDPARQPSAADEIRLLSSSVLDPPKIPLADFAAWKGLEWSRAQSLLLEKGSCFNRHTDWQHVVRREVPNERDPQQPPEVFYDKYSYSRIDCYSYRPSNEKDGAALLAQLSLTYKSDANVPIFANRHPSEISLSFPAAENSDSAKSALLQSLAVAAEKIEGTAPQVTSDGIQGRSYRIRWIRQYKPLPQTTMVELRVQ